MIRSMPRFARLERHALGISGLTPGSPKSALTRCPPIVVSIRARPLAQSLGLGGFRCNDTPFLVAGILG
jgi:hypothetical protein